MQGLCSRFFSSRNAWASHCSGFSCCRAWVLGCVGFRSYSSQVLEHRLIVVAHGLSFSLACGVFWIRIEPMSPTLAGGSLPLSHQGSPILYILCFLYFVVLAQNSLSSSFSTWEDSSRLSLNGRRREQWLKACIWTPPLHGVLRQTSLPPNFL